MSPRELKGDRAATEGRGQAARGPRVSQDGPGVCVDVWKGLFGVFQNQFLIRALKPRPQSTTY